MKNICLMLCATSLALGAAGAATVYEGQPIGSIAVTAPGKGALVAVAFKELSAADEPVSAANIVSTANLQDGDALYVYSGGSYDAWKLEDGAWTKVVKVDAGGTHEGADAASVRAKVGEGFWLIRNGENRDYTKPFYVFGAAVATASTVAKAGVKSLMGNPKREAATPTITGMADGDMVQLATGSAMLNVYTYRSSKNGWTYWNGNVPAVVASPEIPAGTGFWYVSGGSSDVTFAW